MEKSIVTLKSSTNKIQAKQKDNIAQRMDDNKKLIKYLEDVRNSKKANQKKLEEKKLEI